MNWTSYAQNQEDVVLMRALASVSEGFYVDVGAQDPRVDSVTCAFHERGWSGLNVEPVPYWHSRLEAERPRDLNVRAACGARAGVLRLYEIVGTGLSTADSRRADAYAAQGHEVRAFDAPAIRLDALLEQAAPPQIHFLKIDAEGAEPEVLRGIDLTFWRPWVVVVEATVPNSPEANCDDWESLLTGAGYRLVNFDGLNRFYLADEHSDLEGLLSVPANVLDNFTRFSERCLREDIAALQAQAELDRAAAERTIRAIHESTSWRVTAPLRALARFGRAVARTLGRARGSSRS